MTRSDQRTVPGRGWARSARPGGRPGAGRDASATAASVACRVPDLIRDLLAFEAPGQARGGWV